MAAEPARRLAPSRFALRGLRWRLAAWVALVVVVSSGITFVVVYRGTASQLRGQIDKELSGDTGELSRAILEGRQTSAGIERSAARYVGGQPFQDSATALFVAIPGARIQTNTPELIYSSTPDERESQEEQGVENRAAGKVLDAPIGYSTLRLPDIGSLRLLKRQVKVGRGLSITVAAGESLASVGRASEGVARAFILAGVLTLAGALLGALLIGSRFTRPLRRMAAVATRVDAGDLHPRIHEVGRPGDEMRVLADAFNHMLDRLTDAFAGQRAFVADASHELRTPLTVIRGQLEVLAAQKEPSSEEVRRVERLLQAEISRITRLVDDLLLLAKAEQTEFLRVEDVDLRGFVQELWDGVSLIADRRFELGSVPEGTIRADPDRLAQALRNLLANAIDHTEPESGLVSLSVTPVPGSPRGKLIFSVQDDGPGIPPDQWERVFDRFHRTDAARDRASGGAGLGLAIVRAIAEAHGGTVSAKRAQAGGARFDLELPGFSPRGRRPVYGRKLPVAASAGPARGPGAGLGRRPEPGADSAGAQQPSVLDGQDAIESSDGGDARVREHEHEHTTTVRGE
jgi:two-component system, OmpR family, sensor kinase